MRRLWEEGRAVDRSPLGPKRSILDIQPRPRGGDKTRKFQVESCGYEWNLVVVRKG